METISTRGVMISRTLISLNSMADLISSLSCLLMAPSFSTSSTISSSSSSVRPRAVLRFTTLLKAALATLKKKLRGESRSTKTLSKGAQNKANFSGKSLAALLGKISPKIITTTVVMIVAAAKPSAPK